MGLFEVVNDGKNIESTNYFDSEHAKQGYFYLSTNSGCVRLLVPDNQLQAIKDFKAAKYVILSRGPWPEQEGKDALELLFEDFSANPYVIYMVEQQCDMLPDGKGDWILAVWSREGKKFVCPLKYRHVNSIPYLRGWGG